MLRTKRLTIDDVSWTPWTADVACDYVTVINDSAVSIKFRSDDADSTTEHTIAKSSQFGESSPYAFARHAGSRAPRYAAGARIGYLQSSLGTVDVTKVNVL